MSCSFLFIFTLINTFLASFVAIKTRDHEMMCNVTIYNIKNDTNDTIPFTFLVVNKHQLIYKGLQ